MFGSRAPRVLSSPLLRNKSIGFIGLGQMGGRMAPHLITKGQHTLTVSDSSDAAVEPLRKLGATFAATPREVAERSEIVITMLPNGNVVKDVYTNDKTGIFAGVRPGTLLIDCSTIDPHTPKLLNELAEQVNRRNPGKANPATAYVDAPVSGGIMAAEAGTLTFLVGGPAESFQRAEAILKLMGKAVLHCGTLPGSGEIVKLCNNLILGISMIGVSEAMVLGTQLGVDAKTLADAINVSTGRCWSSDTYNPYPGVFPNVPSSRGYSGGFGVDLMLKDLRLAVEAAKGLGLQSPLGDKAREFYDATSKSGMGNLDFSSALKYLEEHKAKNPK